MSQLPGFSYIQSLGVADLTNYSLDHQLRLLELLGNPQDRVRTVHIAGTNGKGSTSACVAAMLRAAGHEVGLYTSPYLNEVTECCVLNGKPVDRLVFDGALCEVAQAAERAGVKPSYFEARTAACFLVFAQAKLDWAVIEVGLGGRLDATNCLKHPQLTIITGIALDHTAILGSTLEHIAIEKCGIFKPGTPAIVGLVTDEVGQEIKKEATRVGVRSYFAGTDFVVNQSEQTTLLRDLTGRFAPVALPVRDFALRGAYQQNNLALSAYAALHLGFNAEQISSGAKRVRWPGRLEMRRLQTPGMVLFDAAHNPQGIECLSEYLESLFLEGQSSKRQRFGKLVIMFGVLESKDWKSMLRVLSTKLLQLEKDFKVRATFLFTEPPPSAGASHTAVPAKKLVDYLGAGFAFADCEAAIAEARRRMTDEDLLVVCGSMYLMGAVRARLIDEPFVTIAESSSN